MSQELEQATTICYYGANSQPVLSLPTDKLWKSKFYSSRDQQDQELNHIRINGFSSSKGGGAEGSLKVKDSHLFPLHPLALA